MLLEICHKKFGKTICYPITLTFLGSPLDIVIPIKRKEFSKSCCSRMGFEISFPGLVSPRLFVYVSF